MIQKIWDVVVIGGGASGMMAAGAAAACGKSVRLLEKNPNLGKKLLITGGGRCNVTNNKPDVRAMLAKYKDDGKFLASTFTQFGVKESIEFFTSHGMQMKEENEGRMFPISNSAQSVWDVLADYMRAGRVKVQLNVAVTNVIYNKEKSQFVLLLSDKTEITARSCIISTGGTSHPETGSTGDGFKWLKKMGHTIIENDMALVPIALLDHWIKSVAGVTLPEVRLTTFKNSSKQKAHKGKLLFTHVGISGPMVLNMSREVGQLLHDEGDDYGTKNEVTIMLDLFPSLDSAGMKDKIQSLLTSESNKKLKNVLSMIMPTALVAPILTMIKIDGETPCHSVRSEDRKALIALLKNIPLHVKGLLGKDKAVVSSGGVKLEEVNFKTMESLKVPNLYLTGDILNINRPSGGYSLQLCWTTGYVAGSRC